MSVQTQKLAELMVTVGNQDVIPESFSMLVDTLEHALVQYNDKNPRKMAAFLALELSRFSGGRQLYVPSLARIEPLLRNVAILNDYYRTSIPVRKLAIKYRLAPSRIYEILGTHKLS